MRNSQLTNTEELALLHRSRAGDSEAINVLCQSLFPLVTSMTYTLRGDLKGSDHDEAYTAAIEAMERAITAFDPACGNKLRTFLHGTVKDTLMHFRTGGPIAVPKQAVFQREATAARQTVGLWQVGEEVELPRSGSLDDVERREITEALDRLRPRDRAVIVATESEGRSLSEAAADLKLSKSQVRVSRDRGIRDLRRLLADYRPEKKSALS